MPTNIAVTFAQLSKHYGFGRKRVDALKELSLSIAGGQVFGFLGPNGAGKTTTIRLLMGLIRPTYGSLLIYGRRLNERPSVLRRVGALVERAAFYPFLTGRQNLEVLAWTGEHDTRRIPRLLDEAGLSRRADEKVGGYSTGMQQRLGLAAALLGDPELLVLDEPTGGLDPAGIHQVRKLLRDWVDEHNKTVFLSSHLLSEVEQVCDRVAIIHQGVIVREGPVEALLSAYTRLRMRVSPAPKAAEVLRASGTTLEFDPPAGEGAAWLHIDAPSEQAPDLVRRLVEHGVDVFEVSRERLTLETIFLEATQQESVCD